MSKWGSVSLLGRELDEEIVVEVSDLPHELSM